MSVHTAKSYLDGMIGDEWRGNGDLPNAIRRVARRIGISHHQIEHIRRGRAKTCDVTLFEKIRHAYLNHCEQQIVVFQQNYREASDAFDPHLLDEAHRLLSDIRQAKAEVGTNA